MARKPPANWSLQPAEEALLVLLRRALFSAELESGELSGPIRWEMVFDEARRQAVLPLAVDAAVSLPEPLRPPESVRSSAVNEVILQVTNNERLMIAQDEMIQILNRSGIPYAILKGTSVAAYYPKPELRVLGDIDLLVDKEGLEKAAQVLQGLGYRLVDGNEHIHLGYIGRSAHVELHFEVTNFPDTQAGNALHDAIAGAVSSPRKVSLERYVFHVLSPECQAISLLMHMQWHMKAMGIGLRHVCDFAMYVYRLRPGEWERDVAPILRQGGLLRFAEVLTKTCVLWLGLPAASAPWCEDVEEEVCRDLMDDFLRSGNFGRKQPSRRASAVLSLDKRGVGVSRSLPVTLIRNLNKYAHDHYSIARKVPLLLPFFWVMLPIQYLRGIAKRKGDLAIAETLASGRTRRKLFAELRIFETDQRSGSGSDH